jgi:hypothetical protein
MKGFGGTALALGVGHAAASAFLPQYRAVNFRLKAWVGVSACVAAFAIRAERQHAINLQIGRDIEADRIEKAESERQLLHISPSRTS